MITDNYEIEKNCGYFDFYVYYRYSFTYYDDNFYLVIPLYLENETNFIIIIIQSKLFLILILILYR
jgi:hypothetical protein